MIMWVAECCYVNVVGAIMKSCALIMTCGITHVKRENNPE